MVGRLLALVLGVGGLAAGSQAPNFTAHFMQNLEGRVDELSMIVQDITTDRERAGVSRTMAQAACEAADSEVLKDDCERAEDTLVRYDVLADLQVALRDENVWKRPLVLGQKITTDDNVRAIAENALKEFKPAIPMTADGAGYAAGAGAGVWGFFHMLFGMMGAPFRRR